MITTVVNRKKRKYGDIVQQTCLGTQCPVVLFILYPNSWLVDWGLTSHQQLRSYGDGTLVYSPIRRTGKAQHRTCDLWYTRRDGGFYILIAISSK